MDLPLRPSRPGMSRRSRTRLSFALAGMIVATAAAAVLLVVFASGAEKLLAVGTAAPRFDLRTPRGVTVSLSALRGKTLLLEFCATWSSACARQVPALNRVAGRYHVLSIDAGSEDAASVDAFARRQRVGFSIVLDPGSKTVRFPDRGPRGAVTASYHVTRLPTLYVLDSAGRVRWSAAGLQPYAPLARVLALATRPLP